MRALKYPALLAFFGMSAIAAPAPGTGEAGAMQNRSITLCVEGGKSFTAVLEDNSSAKALVKLLEKSDISIKMRDYANMEKVGPLGYELPRNDEQTKMGLLQNSPNEKNEIDFPERGCLSHFLL